MGQYMLFDLLQGVGSLELTLKKQFMSVDGMITLIKKLSYSSMDDMSLFKLPSSVANSQDKSEQD